MDGEDKRMTAEEAQGENVSALFTAHPRRSRKPQTFMCMCQPWSPDNGRTTQRRFPWAAWSAQNTALAHDEQGNARDWKTGTEGGGWEPWSD